MKHGKIFVVFSDTGSGHRTAADAINSAIAEVSPQRGHEAPEVVVQDIIESSNAINRLFTHTYNRLLKEHQDWMKYYSALIEWVKPNESELAYRLSKDYTAKVIQEINPAVIVSVHPMVNHFLARTLKDMGLLRKTKLVVVLTDPNNNLWTGWACPDADLTIAPNDLARDQLIAFGLDPAAIKVIGMPIPPQFLKPPSKSRDDLLMRMGFDPNELTIAISAGSAGGGNMPKIYKALQHLSKPVQIIFTCGKNAKLREEMQLASQQSRNPTIVLPYTTRVADGMNACDLLVTKAGGLTTFEAIARRLPMALDMITEPMPQEYGTAEMLIEAGLAKSIKQPEDIVPIVEELRSKYPKRTMRLPKVHNLDHIDAVYEIAHHILDFAN